MYFFRIATILSNVFLIYPILLTLIYHLYIHAFVWTFLLITSMMFHLCRDEVDACVLDLKFLEALDSSFALTAMFIAVIEILYFIVEIHTVFEIGMILIFYIICAVTIFLTGNALSAPSIIVFSTLIVIFVSYIIWDYVTTKTNPTVHESFSKRVIAGWYILGVVLEVIGILSYFAPYVLGLGAYPISHTLWHVFMSFGITAVLYSLKDHLL